MSCWPLVLRDSRKGELKRRTTVRIPLAPQNSAVSLHDRATDGEPQTQSSRLTADEGPEKVIHRIGINSDTRITYGNNDPIRAAVLGAKE
jgi:hypothetical protein